MSKRVVLRRNSRRGGVASLRRLVCGLTVAVLLAAASGSVLWGAERARKTSSTKASANPAPKAPAKPIAGPEAALPALPEPGEGIEIVSPESGSKLRGVATVRVAWNDATGYVIYRVDGQFAYATSSPYEMRWDTSTTIDDEHVLTADAYDSSGLYQGTSSIKVMVENAIPTPPEGMLLQVRFKEDAVLTRRVQARSEIGALTSDQTLPPGFDVLAGELKCDLTQSVMDTFYEGNSALIRNRVREGYVAVGGARRNLPEMGQYAMVQTSRNGLTVPASAAVTRARIGLGEISLALPDTPVFPGDQWESPLGAVFDIYTRRVVFVQAQHTFEGLRWFRGRECAVITSSYATARVPLYEASPQQTASAAAVTGATYRTELTQMMGAGRGARRGAGRAGGPTGGGTARRAAGQTGARAAGGRATLGGGAAAGARRAAPAQATRARTGGLALESVRLTDVKGTRRTYLTTISGRVMHTEDTIMGKVEFRVGLQQASGRGSGAPSLELTGGMMGGGRGAGRMGTARTGRAGAQRQPAAQPSRTAQPQAAAAAQYPSSLDYALRLTGDLVVQ